MTQKPCYSVPVDPEFQKFFWHYVDKRSLPERTSNLVGMTLQDDPKVAAYYQRQRAEKLSGKAR